MSALSDIADTLVERQATHGEFGRTACAAASMGKIFMDYALASDRSLSSSQAHALTMIFVKLARIACGDANHADHWTDIEGYARLARESIR